MYPTRAQTLLVLLLLWAGTLLAEPRFTTVVIDPGHGGKDNGAAWHGLKEKTLNLDVAKRVENLLRKKGIPTVMTRRSDVYVSLEDRARTANKYANSIFVSIHFNAHTNRGISGLETFYASESGSRVAAKIQRQLSARLPSRNRGIKKYPYKVLLLTKATAVLVECGFMSNRIESNRMRTAAHRQRIAEAIAAGIVEARNKP